MRSESPQRLADRNASPPALPSPPEPGSPQPFKVRLNRPKSAMLTAVQSEVLDFDMPESEANIKYNSQGKLMAGTLGQIVCKLTTPEFAEITQKLWSSLEEESLTKKTVIEFKENKVVGE